MLPVREFTNGADVLAHAAEIRRKFYGPRQITPTRVLPAPEKAADEPIVPAGTRQECEKFQLLGDAKISSEVVRDVIDLSAALTPKARAKLIVRAIAMRHGMRLEDIMGRGRTKPVVTARHEAIAAVYVEFSHWSLEAIAQFFGIHHTSVLHAIYKLGVWRGEAA